MSLGGSIYCTRQAVARRVISLSILPFLVEFFPLLRILAREAAKEGFSATINADFIVEPIVFIRLSEKFSNLKPKPQPKETFILFGCVS